MPKYTEGQRVKISEGAKGIDPDVVGEIVIVKVVHTPIETQHGPGGEKRLVSLYDVAVEGSYDLIQVNEDQLIPA